MLPGVDGGRGWALLALLVCCHVYFLQIYPHFVSPNELSRLLLTSALVDDHSLSIDAAMRRYGESQDKAVFAGRYYSDKAIGTSLLGVPVLYVVRAMERIFSVRFSAEMTIFWLRLFAVTLPSLFFLRLLGRFWMQLRPDSNWAPHFIFLYVFGTIAFTYSNQFVSHLLLGMTLFCSAYFLIQCRLHPEHRARTILLAGSFAGASLLLEFPAAIPVAVLCVSAIIVFKNIRKLILFAAPVLIAVLLILGYNQMIFGTPWDVTYRHMTHTFHTSKHAEGLVGMGLPKLEALHGLLFSRHHGLFFISPFLLLSVVGFYRMSRNVTWAFAGNLFIAIVLSTVLTYSAFSYWIAGWNFGPRYITPVVPFVCTAAFYYADEFLQAGSFRRVVFSAIGIWSVLCVIAGTITFPFPPDIVRDPIFFLNFPLLFNNATGKSLTGNPWLFFPLLLSTLLVLIFPARPEKAWSPGIFRKALAAAAVALLLFLVGSFSRPTPTAMEYYARGSVYLYLGKYDHSFEEMKLALNANPDSNARGLIERRMSDLSRFVKP